jgi:hypothetical protein
LTSEALVRYLEVDATPLEANPMIDKVEIEKVPWVSIYSGPDKCDAYRWSQMSLKASRNPELREKYHCKNAAKWTFQHLESSEWGTKGTKRYCTNHLFAAGFHGDMDEDDRLENWLASASELLA